MSLKNRLRTLKRESGQGTDIRPETAPAIADRLDRLRPRREAAKQEREAAPDLGAELNAERVSEQLLLIERRLPLSEQHGEIPFRSMVADYSALPEAVQLAPEQALFIDTETTGLAGGTGTAVFLLGMGRIEGELLLVRQYLITGFAGEAAMLQHAADWLRGDETLVSFNGRSFDVPLLATRCRLAGLDDPFSERPHVDLLHPTRRLFSSRWPDCRLGTAERELLGFLRHDDLPGAEAPEAWFAWLHRGDGRRLPGVVRHNRLDILSLAVLLPRLAEVHAAPREHGGDVLAVARTLLKRGSEGAALRLLSDARHELDSGGLLELARLHRRRHEWEAARAIWEALADDSVEALERLAKYHEHVRRDFVAALALARRLPPSPEREHRCERLLAKLSPSPFAVAG